MTGRRKFTLALIVFSLTGQIAWVVENMYFNVFIYKMFNASAADISLMVAASAVAATLTTIFIGALSDRIGKRKLFMCWGYIAWGISILAFAFVRLDLIAKAFGEAVNAAAVGVTIVIVLDCVMTFFGSSANDAAYNAWLTDRTDETNRGRAEGINSMMPLIAILVVFGGFMGFDLDRAESWTKIYIIIGAVVLFVGVSGFFLVEDAPLTKKPDDLGYLGTILYGFRRTVIRENKGLYAVLGFFVVFGIAIQIFMPYLIIYYEQTLQMSDYVLIMAPAIILAAVFTALYGKVIDRKGFLKASVWPIALLAAGFVFLFLFPAIVPVTGFAMKALVFAGSLFMMCGDLSGMAVFGAEIRNRTPDRMAGRFQGLRIIAQVLIPGVVGPAIGAAVLKNADVVVNSDGTTSFLPNSRIFLTALFVTMILAALIGAYRNQTNKESK